MKIKVKIALLFLYMFLVNTSYAEEKKSVAFVFFGDFGMGNSIQKEVASAVQSFCKQNLCQFILGLGDNFYPNGVNTMEDPQLKEKFEDIYCPMGLKFYATLGNHDYKGNIQAQIQYTEKSKCWWMPANYYEFSREFVDFFAIDTEDLSLQQLLWWQQSLNRSKARWKIVFGHRPVFSFGGHGDSYELWLSLFPLLKIHSVDFYLSGHDHVKQVIPGNGIQYIVSGAAGDPKDHVSSKRGNYSFAKGGPGFGYLNIQENKAELMFIDNKGIVEYKSTIEK